jgi:hypothetical protein
MHKKNDQNSLRDSDEERNNTPAWTEMKKERTNVREQ